ncbi:[pyruvate, water dikinase]-phosphate phosphotransferase / [pyruvate, water dikinase] kinase [Staphylococcus auricularis]|uniref:Putative pyruvate, phosphate dikinase regulatory protein n=1 Tax=Staphylococcus auricularis TaxID=29379 RepID=A0AAP8TSI1_9STAP|nr:pyruvate, water dikinase regulatory protein [Staphylococcus auricularis]MBM0867981.1 kinase/pyrophosphorylase [Staphylococcus auricularis]MCE5038173.1 kinase/pyrophosphorylase [Staphylococcus auricularis]MCG7341021.1 kinase/pyrophosphorylase [Staphylococcus auricularis]MDC6326799.1 kinase/pyrophosphorylase [Staphylococcus auricularis]MDN4532676.1 pyruvate, water dikinase regulatory protein [Staphylococcus auricularis]
MKKVKIIVASDSVGETAELVARAGISQFNPNHCEPDISRYPYIESLENVDEVIQIAVDNHAVIVYTLVKPEIRKYMEAKIKEKQIKSVDIMGPLMNIFREEINEEPYYEPGLVHRLDEAYFKKIEAIEFAVKYDDGKDPKGLSKADIVLLGVSRTSKTPLSQYLAHKESYKVMNIPIVPEVTPPDKLFSTDPRKIIALRISDEKLNRIRRERLKQLGLGDNARYATEQRIKEEIEYFQDLVDKLDCPVIDVSDKAIEETANDIIRIIEQNYSQNV